MIAERAKTTEGPVLGENVTVLVVDDERDMRIMVRAFLDRDGIQVVDEAVDGPAAIEIMERLSPPPVPTVIVLDNRMPTLSGLEVARHVLQRFPRQCIILFSAHLTPDIEREAAELGIRACVSKNEVARLGSIIVELLED